jgi:hypothetical protein
VDSFKFRVEEIQRRNPEALFPIGLTEALMGWAQVEHGTPTLAMYAAEIVIKILQHRDGMTEEEAIEWYEFNILGAYMGPHTPVFVPIGIMDDEEQDFYVERADGHFVPRKIGLFDEGPEHERVELER